MSRHVAGGGNSYWHTNSQSPRGEGGEEQSRGAGDGDLVSKLQGKVAGGRRAGQLGDAMGRGLT